MSLVVELIAAIVIESWLVLVVFINKEIDNEFSRYVTSSNDCRSYANSLPDAANAPQSNTWVVIDIK